MRSTPFTAALAALVTLPYLDVVGDADAFRVILADALGTARKQRPGWERRAQRLRRGVVSPK